MQEKEADEMNERRQSKSSRQQISYLWLQENNFKINKFRTFTR